MSCMYYMDWYNYVRMNWELVLVTWDQFTVCPSSGWWIWGCHPSKRLPGDDTETLTKDNSGYMDMHQTH